MKVILHVLEGPDKGKSFVYDGYQSFVLGRQGQKDTELQVPSDPYMSRHHLQLEFAGGRCTVRDLDSRNGVAVNGDRTHAAQLKHGDVMAAGRTTMSVTIIDTLDDENQPQRPVEGDADLREFDIIDTIGQGNCGNVFRAKWKRKTVAIKLISIAPRETAAAVHHFLREMSIAQKLKHPNLVRALASGRYEDKLWLAMELIDGPTLLELVEKEGRLNVRQALDYGFQLLKGVAYAHQKGYVHRDIKPANILLSDADDGYQVKLCDFGIAKSTRDPGCPSLTLTGRMKGTPRYMPREQVLNAKLAGPPADVFAVGATLYWALTRRWHYQAKGRNHWSTILEGRNIPLRERRRIPAPIAQVIDRALESEPGDRYATAGEMRRALKAAAAACRTKTRR